MRPAATKGDEASVSLTSESSFCEVVTIEDEEEDQQDESDFGESSHIEASDIDPPEFIVQFKAWLKSADGGNLDNNTSEQHGKQIFKSSPPQGSTKVTQDRKNRSSQTPPEHRPR